MKKIVVLIVLFIVVVSVGLVYFTYTKPAPRAATLLPDSTLLFVETPDFPLARAQFSATEAYALLQEPEVQKLFADPYAALANTLGLARADRSASANTTVMRALQGEAFFAVTGISAGAHTQPRVVFGTDVKRKRLEAAAVLGHLKRRLIGTNPSSEKKYLGVRYTLWPLSDDHQLCHAFLNSLLVFTVNEDDLRDIISRYAGHDPADSASLASSTKFQSALRKMPSRHALFAYLNVEQILSLAAPLLALAPQQGGGMFQKVANIQAVASSVTLGDDLVQDVGFVAHAQRDKPLSPPLQRKTLALTAPDTSFYSMHSADLSAAYTQAVNFLAHSGNATISTSAAQFEQAVSDKGIRIGEDLLQKLGPEIAVLGTWRSGARYPDLAFVAEFDNTPESRHALNIVLGALTEAMFDHIEQVSWEENSYRGQTLHTAHLGGKPIAPTYVAIDNFFIFTLTPDYARELVDHLSDSKKTLRMNASFEDVTKRLPKNANAMTYCDLSTVYHQLYALAQATTASDTTNPPFALGKLPSAETITHHALTYASATVVTERGETTVAFSSLGKPLTMVVGIAGAIAAARPLIAQLPLNFIPGLPTTSSDTGAHPPSRENPTATSQTPATQ